jgi:hypothetical protein
MRLKQIPLYGFYTTMWSNVKNVGERGGDFIMFLVMGQPNGPLQRQKRIIKLFVV